MKLQLVGSEHIRPQHIFDTLDNEGERLNEVDETLGHSVHEEYAAVNPELLENINEEEDENTDNREQRYKSIELYNEDEMLKLARGLVGEQRYAFDIMIKYAKDLVKSRSCKQQNMKVVPPLLIINGGSGTGKSVCIRAISKWMEIFFTKGRRSSKQTTSDCVSANWNGFYLDRWHYN